MNAAGAASRVPTSAQQGPHDLLPALIARRAGRLFRRQAAPYSVDAFRAFQAFCAPDEPLIIDSCCGTGESTLHLAESHPRHKVVGVDQSAHRLHRAPVMPPNGLLLRADMVDVWQLMHARGYRPAAQYMLYPNPWPKIGHVARRWPAHPVFPTVLALGGRIECRSNWRVYVEEFALALRLLTGREASVRSFLPDPPLTPFERKYMASGHTLFRCIAEA